MECKPGPAEHDRIPAVTHGVGSYVAVVARNRALIHQRLLRNVDFFKSTEEYQLGIHVVVRFDEPARKRR